MEKTKIGIIGCGAIGTGAGLFIAQKLKNKALVSSLLDMEPDLARKLAQKIRPRPFLAKDYNQVFAKSDLVIEAASQKAASELLVKAVKFKKDIMILSVGALIGNSQILRAAEKKGIKVYFPSGAICGVDGLGALKLGGIKNITLTTSKPPKGLIGAEFLKQKNINLTNLKQPKIVFLGSVKQAVKAFPKNINVAATILTAAGFNNVKVCIKADPQLTRNVHRLEVYAKQANLKIEIENVPSFDNPKTSALTILSTQYLLAKIFSTVKIGS